MARLSDKSSAVGCSVGTCVFILKVLQDGSGHVIEDKCARLNYSVLQIPFPNVPIDQKATAVAIGHLIQWCKDKGYTGH